ncbi:MAG TPA: NFACT RNA binding domain-containing protein [Candidatus Latescibacteria bacterium]|nr:NFACT RNA binding domain-containing protein [Candidatus Latescibacterota bacterium]
MSVNVRMIEAGSDLVWLCGMSRELETAFAGRKVTLYRHRTAPACLLDAGGARVCVADLTPGSSHIQSDYPVVREEWRQWGARRTDGAEVEHVRVRDGDRVISIHLVWRNRIGDEERTELIWELGGLRTNAILVSLDGTVLDVLRPVSERVNRVRTVLPGRPYVPPPTGVRQRLDEPWTWDTGDGADTGGNRRTVREFLAGGFLASSGFLADELLARCGVDGALPVAQCGRETRVRIESEFRNLLADPSPHLLLDESGEPAGYCGYRPTHVAPDRVAPAGSFCEAATRTWRARRESQPGSGSILDQLATWRGALRKLLRQRDNLRGDVVRAEQAGELRRLADLIMANLSDIPEGTEVVTLTDWFQNSGATVQVRLDPTRNAASQAEQLYRRAKRLQNGLLLITARLRKTELAINSLEQQIREAEDAARGSNDQRVRRYQMQGVSDGGGRKQPFQGIRPRRYRTKDGGWLVLVGRNDDENDALSLKATAPDDLWFHAQGCPGSHVVLKKEGRKEQPGRQAIAEAAAVAAYWSKARGSSKVGVSYTLGKYVTKPRGSPPGTVTIRHEKLITVPPALLPLADEVQEATQ